MSKPVVAGVGMVKFAKPGASKTYPEMSVEAMRDALADAGLGYDAVQQVYAGYVYGDSTCGQRAVYELGMTGVPVVNVNNNCSSGSTALWLARQAVESGAADCVLALGFEEMRPGALGTHFNDRVSPFEWFDEATDRIVGHGEVPLALRYFGGAGLSYMQKHGIGLIEFARIRAKASRHAARNPLALFRQEVTADEVMASPVMWPGVMHRLMACPPTCGAAAAIVVSEAYARRHGLSDGVRIVAQEMRTDFASTFEGDDMMRVVGYDMTSAAAKAAYDGAGIGPQDIDVVELHDCFAQNELITYEGLGLCPEGGAQKFIADGDNSYGGQVVTNPSGGLLSKLTRQLRGTAGPTQVEGARIALQHNLGIGGACVVTVYQAH
ncbi:MAG: lipid-transfer protein [Mesorhizobium sp.]